MKKYMHPVYDYSELKVLMFKDWVKKFMNGEDVFPVNFEFSITNLCNLDCFWCIERYYREKYPVHIKTDVAMRAISEMAELGTQSITFEGGGEPTVHPDATKIFKHAIDVGLEAGLITNGVLLEKIYKDLTDMIYVRISLDAYDRETYKRIKRYDAFEKVMNGIKLLVENAPDTIVGISYILYKPINTDPKKIEQLILRLRDIGVDYIQFKPVMLFDENKTTRRFEFFPDVVEKLEELKTQYEDKNFKIFISRGKPMPKFYPTCYVHLLKGYIAATGDVYLCCQRKLFEERYGRENLVFGNIYEQSLKEIWEGEKRRKILEEVYSRGSEYTKECPACPYMHYNYILNILRHGNIWNMNKFV